MKTYAQYFPEWNETSPKKHLVVFVHGLRGKREKGLAFLSDIIRENETLVFAPKLPHASLLAITPITTIAKILREDISNYVQDKDITKISLIGHSTGAQIVREMYSQCWQERLVPEGEPADFVLKPDMEWIQKIDRILYLAGIHRGWTVDAFLSRTRQFFVRIGDSLTGRKTTVGGAHRGAKELIALRLRAIEINKFLGRTNIIESPPITVQMLGSVDDLVDPTSQLPSVMDDDHFFIEVPGSGHMNLIHTPSIARKSDRCAEERQAHIRNALYDSRADLKKNYPANFLFANRGVDIVQLQDKEVTDVVFIIHGIRDKGYWTAKIGRMIRRKEKELDFGNDRKFVAVYPTYGYFPILDFTFPHLRKDKTAWLADQYVIHRAQYPNAVFHYVGHSNGTQIFSEAISTYPDLKFERVIFAGSVVKRGFDWDPFFSNGQIKKLRNYVATNDFVVAILSKGLQAIGDFNLGSAGHDGFKQFPKADVITPEIRQGENVEYIRGTHSAAIKDSMWDEIATFVTTGAPSPQTAQAVWEGEQVKATKFFGSISGLIVGLIATLAIGLFVWLLTWLAEANVGQNYDTMFGVWREHHIKALNPVKLLQSPAGPLFGLFLYWTALKFFAKKF